VVNLSGPPRDGCKGSWPPPVADGLVEIELPSDVALVLFDWIERRADDEWARLSDAHSGERCALTVLAGALQSRLVDPFKPEYARWSGPPGSVSLIYTASNRLGSAPTSSRCP